MVSSNWTNSLHLGWIRPKREKVMTSLLKEVCSSDISDPRLCSLAEGLNTSASIWQASVAEWCCGLQWWGVRAGRAATFTAAVIVHSSSSSSDCWWGRPTFISSARCLLLPTLRCSGRAPRSLFSSDSIFRGWSLSPMLQHSIILKLICYRMSLHELHKYFSWKPRRVRDVCVDWWSATRSISRYQSFPTCELLLISKLLFDYLYPLLIFVANAFEYSFSLQVHRPHVGMACNAKITRRLVRNAFL